MARRVLIAHAQSLLMDATGLLLSTYEDLLPSRIHEQDETLQRGSDDAPTSASTAPDEAIGTRGSSGGEASSASGSISS